MYFDAPDNLEPEDTEDIDGDAGNNNEQVSAQRSSVPSLVMGRTKRTIKQGRLICFFCFVSE